MTPAARSQGHRLRAVPSSSETSAGAHAHARPAGRRSGLAARIGAVFLLTTISLLSPHCDDESCPEGYTCMAEGGARREANGETTVEESIEW